MRTPPPNRPGAPSAEERIGALAVRQHGVVTRAQLLALGLSPAAVGRRTRAGHLRALHSGVYLVGPLEPERAMEMAGVLAGGPKAVLSHTNALQLWKLLSIKPPRPVHVTVPGGGRGGRKGIVFHRAVALDEDERTVLDGIPTTTPIRTIVDAAGMLGHRDVERALATAEREGLVRRSELTGLPDRYPRRAGMAMLRNLLRDEIGPSFTRSEAERRCLELLRRAGLPRPHVNVAVGPYELDLFWPTEGVAVEVDGYKHHSARSRFEGDRRKDAWLRAHGIEVVRLTWRQITRNATATAVQVGQALALARERKREGEGGDAGSA